MAQCTNRKELLQCSNIALNEIQTYQSGFIAQSGWTGIPVYASDIFATAKNAMQTVYTDVAGIATVAAVVCAAVCLFLMNFSKSGRTVDESRSWLKRIVVCWAALMTLGAIVTYLEKIIPKSMFTG